MFRNKETFRLINLSADGQNPAVVAQGLQGEGKVGIFSHLLFQEDNPKYTQYPGIPSFRQNRDESLRACLRSGQPLIILEQIHRYEQLKTHLKQLGGTGHVYAFLTPYFDPIPISPAYFQDKTLLRRIINDYFPIDNPSSEVARLKRICWDNFAQILRLAQITFVELGGQCLAFYDEKDLENPNYPDIKIMQEIMRTPNNGRFMIDHNVERTLIPEYCVGTTAIQLLQKGFDVSISLPTWPNGLWRESSLLFP